MQSNIANDEYLSDDESSGERLTPPPSNKPGLPVIPLEFQMVKSKGPRKVACPWCGEIKCDHCRCSSFPRCDHENGAPCKRVRYGRRLVCNTCEKNKLVHECLKGAENRSVEAAAVVEEEEYNSGSDEQNVRPSSLLSSHAMLESTLVGPLTTARKRRSEVDVESLEQEMGGGQTLSRRKPGSQSRTSCPWCNGIKCDHCRCSGFGKCDHASTEPCKRVRYGRRLVCNTCERNKLIAEGRGRRNPIGSPIPLSESSTSTILLPSNTNLNVKKVTASSVYLYDKKDIDHDDLFSSANDLMRMRALMNSAVELIGLKEGATPTPTAELSSSQPSIPTSRHRYDTINSGGIIVNSRGAVIKKEDKVMYASSEEDYEGMEKENSKDV